MTVCDAAARDLELAPGERTEQMIGARGYTVLRCAACSATRRRWRPGRNRRWLDCGACGYRTLSKPMPGAWQPLEGVTGFIERRGQCAHCGHGTTEAKGAVWPPALQTPLGLLGAIVKGLLTAHGDD